MHPRRLLLSVAALGAALASTSTAQGAALLLPADIDALPRGAAVETGEVIVQLDGAARSRLSAAGATLRGAGEVSVKGATVTLQADPAAEAWIDPTTMRGSVGIDGSLSIAGKRGTAKLTDLTFSPGNEKKVTAKLGKKTITLGALTGGSASFSKQADGLLKRAKLSLSRAGAKAINAKIGGGVAAGALGTVTIDVTTRELPLDSGTATLTLDPAVMTLLSESGFALEATAPATRSGNVVTIALTAGAFDPVELTGRLKFDGALHFANASTGKAVDLFGFRAAVTGSQKDLYAQVSAAVTPVLGTLDLSGVEAGLDGKTFHATGGKVFFSKIAVSTLKQSFGVSVNAGQLLGTVDLTGTISGVF
ncbi:MAG: hypothetical protein QM679_12170 [Patulibacter sp.]